MPDLDAVLDVVAGICLLVGALLSLAAGLGLLRFPDVLSRLHAGTKPQILGLVFVVAGIALSARAWSVVLVLAPVVVFQLLTQPVAAHMVARAAYRTGNHRTDLLVKDDLEAEIDRASKRTE
jgi:multicomponent Na+:H+ antiporter subunit G